jgi:hypothetical protein
MSKATIDDLVDEEEIEWEMERLPEGKSINLLPHACPQRLNGTVATRFFVPLKNMFTKYINKQKFYLYNCNEDVAKNQGWVRDNCNFEIKLQKQIQDYYVDKPTEIYAQIAEVRAIPHFDMPTSEYVAAYNLHDPNTYNDQTCEKLITAYNMKEAEETAMREIFSSTKVPIVKAMQISRLINKTGSSKADFSQIIDKVFKEFMQQGPIEIENENVDLIKLDYLSAGDHKHEMILRASGYKSEIMQLETLFPNLAADLIIGNVCLDNFRRRSLNNHLNTILNYYKTTGNKVKLTFFSFLKRFINGLKDESSSNRQGLMLEEQIRILIEKNSDDIKEFDDDELLFSEPTNNVLEWRVKR